MTRPTTAAYLAAPPLALAILVLVLVGSGAKAHHNTTPEPHNQIPTNAELNDDAVPEWARPALRHAATTCPPITAPLLAAQIHIESAWNPHAHNPTSHATGLAQFIPTTWAAWGTDGNGDNHADPHNPDDAITSQAAYLCHLHTHITTQPHLHGDPIDLTLAAYNAGPATVDKYHGIPPFPETTTYITKIRTLATTTYTRTPPPTTNAQHVINKAAEHVNRTMYAWGGGTLHGPSQGTATDHNTTGFDCSSLIRYAYYQGTHHHITLPRTAQEQYNTTKSNPITLNNLQPGDLLFWANQGHIYHVALYIGNNRMIEAPQSGHTITETTIRTTHNYAGATRILNNNHNP